MVRVIIPSYLRAIRTSSIAEIISSIFIVIIPSYLRAIRTMEELEELFDTLIES